MANYIVHVPFNREYIDNISQGSREDQVDHLWNNIFVYYFQRPHPGQFSVEREAYLSETRGWKTNLAVINRRGNPPRMQKVILFEAKRTVGQGQHAQPTEEDWEEVREQLKNNMTPPRGSGTRVQRMYGVTAIGLYARMYQLSPNDDVLRRLTLREYHVRDDSMAIQRVLQGLCRHIMLLRNT